MARLKALHPDETTGRSKELFNGIQKKLGMVPNMMRTMGNSPAALEAYLNLGDNLGKGRLGAKIGELIALSVAESNKCDYCLSAHTYIGENLVKIDEDALKGARNGKNADSKIEAALQFSKVLVEKKGMVSSEDVRSIKDAGYSDGEITEVIGHVALNIFTNYVNHTAQTEIDFPVVAAV